MANYNGIKQNELKQKSFVQRIFGRQPKENAIIEIRNLISTIKNISDIKDISISSILEKYDINLRDKMSEGLKSIYQDYLLYCLTDKHISDSEASNLLHLKNLLRLQDADVIEIHAEVVSSIYKNGVEQCIADGHLSPEERDFLSRLQKDLRLDDELANKIYSDSTGQLIKNYAEKAISDQRLSPEEENELGLIAKSLGIELKIDARTQQLLGKYRNYWLIENASLPEVDVEIHLQKSEKCYFYCMSEWYETKRITQRIRYGGPTARIRIAKGLYWSMGDIAVQSISKDVLLLKDTGTIYLTNKRVIFIGSKVNCTIGLPKILDYSAYSDGIEIYKSSGKNPLFKFADQADVFCLLMNRLICDSNN